jgi:voltage-gated potassium channel
MAGRGEQTARTRAAPELRRALHAFFSSLAVEIVVTLLILASVGFIVVEATLPPGSRALTHVERLSDLLTGLFVVELALRLWAAPSRRTYLRHYWWEFLSVLPLVRPLRILRILRILRLYRVGLIFHRRLSSLRGVLASAGAELTILGTFAVILVVASAVTLHLVERHTGSGFSSLSDALWFAISSLVTGEPTGGSPATLLGRSITLVLMLGGVTIFGVFVGTVSAGMVTRLTRQVEINDMDTAELRDHVLVCGWNHAGPLVVEELLNGSGKSPPPVVIITEDERMPPDVPIHKVRRELLYYVHGDYTRVEVLEQAAVAHASKAILLSDKTRPRSDQDRDARTVLAALTIERLNKRIFTCAELRSREHQSLLKRSGVEEIVVADEYSGYILGSVGRTSGLVATFDEILSTRYGNAFYKVPIPKHLEAKTVGEIHRLLKAEHEAILISLERPNAKSERVIVNPPSDLAVGPGDQLVVIAREKVVL